MNISELLKCAAVFLWKLEQLSKTEFTCASRSIRCRVPRLNSEDVEHTVCLYSPVLFRELGPKYSSPLFKIDLSV